MNPQSQDNYTRAYNSWVTSRSPEAMADLVETFMPTINAEVSQYAGPKELLRSRARYFTIQAIKSFNPMGDARLNSWVVTNLKQLSRYGKRLRPVRASEDMIRNAAELNSVSKRLEDDLGRKPTDAELQDETGWNPRQLAKIRSAVVPAVNGSVFDPNEGTSEDAAGDPALIRPDPIPFAQDAVYAGLGDRDKEIYDMKLGLHGKNEMSGKGIADLLHVTPAYVSQRSSSIGSQIADLAGGEPHV